MTATSEDDPERGGNGVADNVARRGWHVADKSVTDIDRLHANSLHRELHTVWSCFCPSKSK